MFCYLICSNEAIIMMISLKKNQTFKSRKKLRENFLHVFNFLSRLMYKNAVYIMYFGTFNSIFSQITKQFTECFIEIK